MANTEFFNNKKKSNKVNKAKDILQRIIVIYIGRIKKKNLYYARGINLLDTLQQNVYYFNAILIVIFPFHPSPKLRPLYSHSYLSGDKTLKLRSFYPERF